MFRSAVCYEEASRRGEELGSATGSSRSTDRVWWPSLTRGSSTCWQLVWERWDKQTNKQIFRGDINRRIIVNRMYFYFVPSRIGWVADCLLVSDPHEDNANLHVPTLDWSGESSLHIMCRALLLTKECQLKEDVEEEKAQSSFDNIQYCKHTYLCRHWNRKENIFSESFRFYWI